MNIYKAAKRISDIVVSFILLFLFFPLLLVLFLVLKSEGKGSVFFKQQRIGIGGKPFYIYKFRTMVPNAEKILKENKELYERYIANGYKLESSEDPRITKTGVLLRKTSLDELPQLINVVKGDMSLVGPRPVVEAELVEYKSEKDTLLSVKPGVTGYWQVNGRSTVDYPERANLELYYAKNHSVFLDIKIMFLTLWVVLKKEGAQ